MLKTFSTSWSDELSHPLDQLEEIVSSQEWAFDRASKDELALEAKGAWQTYPMFFLWQPELEALSFAAVIEEQIPEDKIVACHQILSHANQHMWLGHFDLSLEENFPSFRYTLLARGQESIAYEQLEEVITTAIMECDRVYPLIKNLLKHDAKAEQLMKFFMFDAVGQA